MALDSGEILEVEALINAALTPINELIDRLADSLIAATMLKMSAIEFENVNVESLRPIQRGLPVLKEIMEHLTFQKVKLSAGVFNHFQEWINDQEELELPENLKTISVENGFVSLTSEQFYAMTTLLELGEEEE